MAEGSRGGGESQVGGGGKSEVVRGSGKEKEVRQTWQGKLLDGLEC